MRRECDENVVRCVTSLPVRRRKASRYRCLVEADEKERDAREKFAEPGKIRDTAASFDGGRIVVRSPRERRTIPRIIECRLL